MNKQITKFSLTLLCLLLLAGFFAPRLLVADEPDEPPLEGREVIVRVYENWQLEPAAYRLTAVEVKARKIRFDFQDVAETAVVAVFSLDQKDRLLEQLMGGRLYCWAYKKGLEFTLPRYETTRPKIYDLVFADALGNPLPNASVKIFLWTQRAKTTRQICIGNQRVNKQGQLKLPFYPGNARAYLDVEENRLCLDSGGFCFEVSQADYKYSAVVRSYPDKAEPEKPTVVFVPFVPAESEAYQRSIWGKVVDEGNNPVGGVLVQAKGLYPLGGLWVGGVRHQSCGVLTDSDGRFRMYLPVREDYEHIGTLIPPASEYSVKIEPPGSLGFEPFRGRIRNGRETIIKLEYAGPFRRFAFEDADGRIADQSRLRRILVGIERSDNSCRWLGYEQWKNGGRFPCGTYRAKLLNLTRRSFEFSPLKVTTDSPDRLVFKMPAKTKRYYGLVVDGVTAEALEGAFVVDATGVSSGRNLSELTERQWDALHQLPGSVSFAEKHYRQVLEPVDIRYSANYSDHRLVRTNKNGRYELKVPGQRHMGGVVIFEQNYLSVIIKEELFGPDDNGDFGLPTAKLFPAARIVVEPCFQSGEEEAPGLWTKWVIYKNNNPPWCEKLLAACRQDYMQGVRADYSVDTLMGPQSVYVPAGLNLEVQLRPWRIPSGRRWKRHWSAVTIAENIKLRRGQVLDLGRVEIKRSLRIYVDVADSAGQPVEGVPVTASSQYGEVTYNSDENGVATFDLARDSKGQFVVKHKPDEESAEPVLSEAIPYQISGTQDANSVYTMTVSGEMLNHLFK